MDKVWIGILVITWMCLQSVQFTTAQDGTGALGNTETEAGEEQAARPPNPNLAEGARAAQGSPKTSTRAVQTDTTTIRYEALACEGSTLVMKCPTGYDIKIQETFFGRKDDTTCLSDIRTDITHCNTGGAKDLLISRCEGRGECTAPATVAFFGEVWPCNYKTAKYLALAYTCQQTIYTALVCEATGHIPLACPKNRFIVAKSAFFGRSDFTTCPHTEMHSTSCSADNAFEIFKQICDGKDRCEITARTAHFGDPCEGTFKYLKMEYTCAECVNDHGDDAQCEFWANSGECDTNPEFMIPKCRKACWKCSKSAPECVNAHGDDIECEYWAAIGECDRNPAWLYPYCRKACSRCNELTTCTNRHDNDAECRLWAEQGECWQNAQWMMRNCMRECFGCTTDFVECKDRRSGPQECAVWANDGDCFSNPDYMLPYCFKSCTNCTSAPECKNLHFSDADCEQYKEEGRCRNEAPWMLKNCWKSCIGCGGQEGLVSVTKKVFMDVEIDNKLVGRVVFGLFGDIAPLTVDNFANFSVGWQEYSYVGTPFHRVIKDFVIQGGDVWNQDGTGRISIYGPRMDDENFKLNHWGKGWVNMANAGPDDNGSQFAILLGETGWLNGKHVVFAKILEGMEVLHAIEEIEVDSRNRPSKTIGVAKAEVIELDRPVQVEKRPVKDHENCENFYFNDAECEFWRNIGECKTNPRFMMTWCYKSCSRCVPDVQIEECGNVNNNVECEQWAYAGDCQTNPSWMIPFCKRSCTFCDRSYITEIVGNEALPGKSTVITKDNTIIMGDPFPTHARLTHFAAFFVNTNLVELEIWRDYGDRIDRFYTKRVTPFAADYAQTVLVDDCVYVRPGDRLGFSAVSGLSPIAFNFDLALLEKPTLYRKATADGDFGSMGLPYAWSLAASYDETDYC